MRYDIAVIGNDEAALELLCMAGSLGKRVLAILPEQRHSEWMISIALRRLVEQLLNDGRRTRLNESARRCTPGLVKRLLTNALTSETMDYMAILERLGVDVRIGEARLLSRNSVMITSGMDCSGNVFIADNVVIGCGTRRTATHRPLGLVPSTGPESLLAGAIFPETVTILGGDRFGAGFSALLSVIGVESEFITHGRADCAMQELAVATGVRMIDAASVDEYARKRSRSGRSRDVLDFRRSVGFTEHLGLADVGVEPDELGRLWCASSLETWCSGVFGIGAVVGFSADISRHPTDQARRILNRISHHTPRPHFLRNRETRLSATSAHVSD